MIETYSSDNRITTVTSKIKRGNFNEIHYEKTHESLSD